MKPEAQRVAIGEACGWKFVEMKILSKDYIALKRPDGFHKADEYPENRSRLYKHLPDYLTDLNAMHEAEEHCFKTMEQWKDYSFELRKLVPVGAEWSVHSLLHATAAQRAEAFLRTLSLWKE